MAKYKAYPEYKDSGVEWLKAIPEHWKLSKLRYQFVFGKGLTITKEHLQDEGIPCVNYGEVHSKYGFEVDPEIHTLKCVSDKYLKDNSNSLLAKGDIVFADTSEDIDGSGNFTQLVSDTVTFAGYHTIIARPFERENSRFYAYLLDCKELRSQVRHAVKGVKVFSITQAILRNLSIWLPSKDEQAQIAAFLDHETAKIDNLIEKQQQLIELLKEKRQAVISHAVTKGLNPDVPMKDSGVEWLGEVPDHWDICLLKFKCSAITDGAHISPDTNEGEHYFVSIKDIKKGIIDFNNSLLTSSASYKYLLKTGCKPFSGDILFSKDGTIGQTAIVPDDVDFVVASSLIIIRADKEKTLPAFMDLLLQSSLVKEQVESFVKGAALRRLSIQNLEKVFGIFPTLSEQQVISDYIYAQLNRLDVLESKAVVQIQLLQERRTALISAAVTGKIDVRDWVAPETQDVEEPEEATA